MARASTSKRERNAFCAAIQGCKNFTATGRPSVTRSPWYTIPIAPEASFALILYRPCRTVPTRGSGGSG
jgi:hypothetical protein